MWCLCGLPDISGRYVTHLLHTPRAGMEGWAPFKAKVLVLVTKS